MSLMEDIPSNCINHDEGQGGHNAWEVLHEWDFGMTSCACINPEPPSATKESSRDARAISFCLHKPYRRHKCLHAFTSIEQQHVLRHEPCPRGYPLTFSSQY